MGEGAGKNTYYPIPAPGIVGGLFTIYKVFIYPSRLGAQCVCVRERDLFSVVCFLSVLLCLALFTFMPLHLNCIHVVQCILATPIGHLG